MALTLTILNLDRLDNGEPTQLVLDRHGARIGRSPHADWCLPDPRNHISSTHCEIEFRDGGYLLSDKSTNGLFLNGATERLARPHLLAEGDELAIGHYRIAASLSGADQVRKAEPTPARGWSGWDDAPGATPAASPSAGWGDPPPPQAAAPLSGWSEPAPAVPAPPPSTGWGAPPPSPPPASGGWAPEPAGLRGDPAEADSRWREPGSAISGRGAGSDAWGAPSVAGASAWPEAAPAPAPSPASPPPPGAPDAVDVWARMASVNSVDWSRGGMDGAAAWASPPAAPVPAPAPAPAPAVEATVVHATPPGPSGPDPWTELLTAAGLTPADVDGDPAEAAARAGDLMRRMAAGLVVMLEARARAKAELGAQGTSLDLSGNNPLKFARTPEQALGQLLNPPQRGFMPADRAVEDGFKDLQAHQMATLAAMQGALRTTLDRFSPQAIRDRAEGRGLLAKILPGAREAALWKAYEREFEGVVQGSDEAFMDVFAKAFRRAYEDAANTMRRKR